MIFLKYISYVFRHRWFVFLECCKMRIPWLGIIHDWSKFRPSEFIPYAYHFFRATDLGIKTGRDETGYYSAGETDDPAFNFAWFLHQKRNKHHWQFWIFPVDFGRIKILEIPLKYRKEMLADWRGAGRAQGTLDTKKWYLRHKYKMLLGSETRKWIEANL